MAGHHAASRGDPIQRLAIGEKGHRSFVQRALVAFQRQQPVRPGVGDGHCSPVLATHRVEAHHAALHVELAQQLGHCGDLVALLSHGKLAKGDAAAASPRADNVQRFLAALAAAAAQGLAVDGDEFAFQCRAAAGDHRGEAVHEGLRVDGGEDPGIGVGRRQAVGQFEVLAQPVLPLAAEDRDVLEAIHAADGRGQGDEKDLAEVVPRGGTLTRIGELTEGIQAVGEAFTIAVAVLRPSHSARVRHLLQKVQRLFESYVRLPWRANPYGLGHLF
jgi:hypothetical protein